MSRCKKCDIEISALEDNLYSGYCENCYEDIYGKKVNNYINKNNGFASMLKFISIIIAVICIIAFIVEMVNDEIEIIAGIALIIATVMGTLFVYGFGEIIQLLEDIKNK